MVNKTNTISFLKSQNDQFRCNHVEKLFIHNTRFRYLERFIGIDSRKFKKKRLYIEKISSIFGGIEKQNIKLKSIDKPNKAFYITALEYEQPLSVSDIGAVVAIGHRQRAGIIIAVSSEGLAKVIHIDRVEQLLLDYHVPIDNIFSVSPSKFSIYSIKRSFRKPFPLTPRFTSKKISRRSVSLSIILQTKNNHEIISEIRTLCRDRLNFAKKRLRDPCISYFKASKSQVEPSLTPNDWSNLPGKANIFNTVYKLSRNYVVRAIRLHIYGDLTRIKEIRITQP